jgi:hypothetical protein
MLWLARKSWQTLATWGRALSCWKIRWCCCTNGIATGRRISSLYLTPVKLPAIGINGDFNPWGIPPQTISEPPPNIFSQERKRRRSVPHDVDHPDEKVWTATHLWKRPVSIASLEIVWDHVMPSHTTRATCTSERKTSVRSTSSETKLAQSVSHIFGWMWRLWFPTVVKAVSVAVTWRLRRWARRIALSWRGVVTRARPPSRTVCNPSSISQTTDKTLYGGNIHTKLQSNLLPLTLH